MDASCVYLLIICLFSIPFPKKKLKIFSSWCWTNHGMFLGVFHAAFGPSIFSLHHLRNREWKSIAHIKQWDIWSYVPCLSIEMSRAIEAGFLFVQFWEDLPISLVTWKFKNPKPNKEESFNFLGEDDGNKEFPTAIMDPLSKLGFPEIPIFQIAKKVDLVPPNELFTPPKLISSHRSPSSESTVTSSSFWPTGADPPGTKLVELWRC